MARPCSIETFPQYNEPTRLAIMGFTGELILGPGEPLRYSDLVLGVLPGFDSMALLGGPFRLLVTPDQLEKLPSHCLLALLETSPDIEPPLEAGERNAEAWIEVDPTVEQIVKSGDLVTPRDRAWFDDGRVIVCVPLKVGEPAMPDRNGFMHALMRWCAFASAHPERCTLTNGALEDDLQAAARFVALAAGREQSPYATRLRRAIRALEDADGKAACQHILEAVCLRMRLPASLTGALLCDEETGPDALHRRELIYVARAGTDSLRAVAASRLQLATRFGDVRKTLEQLRADRNCQVRAAARVANGL